MSEDSKPGEFLCEIFESLGFSRKGNWEDHENYREVSYERGGFRIRYGFGSREGVGGVVYVNVHGPQGEGEKVYRVYGFVIYNKRMSPLRMESLALAQARRNRGMIKERLEDIVFPT